MNIAILAIVARRSLEEEALFVGVKTKFLMLLALLACVFSSENLWAQDYRIPIQFGGKDITVVLDAIKDLEGLSLSEIIRKMEVDHGITVVHLSEDASGDSEAESHYRGLIDETTSGLEKGYESPAYYLNPLVPDHPHQGQPVIVFRGTDSTAVAKHELVHHLIFMAHQEVLSRRQEITQRIVELNEEIGKLTEEALPPEIANSSNDLVIAYMADRLLQIRLEMGRLDVESLKLLYQEEFLVNNLLLSHRKELGLTEREQAMLLNVNAAYLSIAKKDIEEHRIGYRAVRRDITRSDEEHKAVGTLLNELSLLEKKFEGEADDMRKTYPELDILAHEILAEDEPDYQAFDLRERLGLEAELDLTQDKLDRAYRKLAMKYHPDKSSTDPNANEKYNAYTEAYKILSRQLSGDDFSFEELMAEAEERLRRAGYRRPVYRSPEPRFHYRPGGFTNWVAKAATSTVTGVAVGAAGGCLVWGVPTDLSDVPVGVFAGVGFISSCFGASDPNNPNRTPIENPIRRGVRSGLIRGSVVLGCMTGLFAVMDALM